jgi:hypothetical protein
MQREWPLLGRLPDRPLTAPTTDRELSGGARKAVYGSAEGFTNLNIAVLYV